MLNAVVLHGLGTSRKELASKMDALVILDKKYNEIKKLPRVMKPDKLTLHPRFPLSL